MADLISPIQTDPGFAPKFNYSGDQKTSAAPAAAVSPAPNLNAIPGETVDQYEARLGAMDTATGDIGKGTGFGTPVPAQPVTDLNTAHDEVAKQLGFNSYQDALAKLGAPSEDTTKFYNDAYTSAGLDALANTIAGKQSDLNTALGKINDNPWLDEANRVGRSRNLQLLANGDIKNLTNEYNTKLKSVHDLVTAHSKDLATTDAMNKAKLTLLESQAKSLAAEAATKQKQDNAAPKTIKGANGATFQWNTKTNSFDQILPGKTVSTDPNTVLPKFNKDLANRTTLDKAGTREQFIRQLQTLYPTINPNDIARKVYETYPDGYEKTGSGAKKGTTVI
jgi:hypothetical protein